MVDDDREVSLPLPVDLIRTVSLSPANGSRRRRLLGHALEIRPTVRHAIRISSETAVFEAWAASQAT